MVEIQRRGFLAFAALAAGLSACGRDAATTQASRTFVLVHGALHGGWCWRRVARLLRASDADVFAPTLAGLGQRSHINSPQIGLSTHIQDVVNCIEFEELENVVLVGHSYAGMVITGVAEKIADKLSQLVYLDAVVPRSGKSALDAMGGLQMDPAIEMLFASADTDFGIADPADLAWVRRRLTPQSARTFREPLAIQGDLSKMRRTYIACTADSGTGSGADIARRTALARTDATWRREDIRTGHDAMVTAPHAVADLLLDIARGG